MHLTLDLNNSLQEKQRLSCSKKLAPCIQHLRLVHLTGRYEDPASSINLPKDKHILTHVENCAKKVCVPDILVVIGIGGSNLGTVEVQQAVLGTLHNELGRKPRIYYADTVDPSAVRDIVTLCERGIVAKKEVLLNVISKSGTTMETIANAAIFFKLFERYNIDLKTHVVITTDEHTPIWKFSEEQDIPRLVIPESIGGRYSVLSSVGLFPLYMLGIDCHSLLGGAREMAEECLATFDSNPAAQRAAILYTHLREGEHIHNLFLFSTYLEALGKWYRQLMAESLGKKHTGITPIVSIGTTDMHSMAQLYFGGPKNIFTTFVSVGAEPEVRVPAQNSQNNIEQIAPVAGKTLQELRSRTLREVQQEYTTKKLHFTSTQLASRSSACIGAFLQLSMMETMYLAHLLGVNAFDQPNVEAYKQRSQVRKYSKFALRSQVNLTQRTFK